MKILIAGTWLYSMYEKALADALGEYGHTVIGYSWVKFFRSTLGKFENKYAIGGFYTNRMNKDLLSKVKNECPDIFLAWRATNIFPATLRKMRNYGVKYVASYNHDDFTGPSLGAPVPIHHFLHWRLYLKAAKYYDCHFVKRESNIKHLEQLGSSHNEIMPMWFVPLYHRPVALTPDERARFSCDAVFIGHYEPDDRVNHLAALVKAGLSVKLFGDRYWTTHVLGDLYSYFSPITPAVGDNYAKALCGAKVCLAFLSKLNRDTYTRRCFEIPACGPTRRDLKTTAGVGVSI